MENTATEKEPVIYDAEAVQRIPLGDGVFAVMQPYDEKTYREARTAFIKAVNEASENEDVDEAKVKAGIETDIQFTDKLLQTLEGYPELPEDWKDLISVEDKQKLFNTAYGFVIDEDQKKFSLGSIVVPTACYFNGNPVRQTTKLRRKTIDDSSRYALIQSKDYKPIPAKKFGENGSAEFTPQDEARISLFDDMWENSEGFKNNNIPPRVKLLIIGWAFRAVSTVPQGK